MNSSSQSRPKMDIINGCSCKAYEVLGAHPHAGTTHFAVWAPHAYKVSLVGTFNGWRRDADPMDRDYDTGIWEIDRQLPVGSLYKYCINDEPVLRADPLAFYTEQGSQLASIVSDIDAYSWNDDEWIKKRRAIADIKSEPISIYELHLGGWKRPGGNFPCFRTIVNELIDYVTRYKYTHVELLPVAEHFPYESWGYQITGYFAPTSRYGTPTPEYPNGTQSDFMYFVDKLHQAGIGIIFDWAPTHFSRAPGGLEGFDSTYLYENPPNDPDGQHTTMWVSPAPGTLYFNFRHGAVRSFLNSVMPFWIEKYHIDGFRLDALFGAYLIHTGRDSHGEDQFQDNYAGTNCIKQLNHTVHSLYGKENVFTCTEGIDRPDITQPVEVGKGSGFDFKWNMGWFHDIMIYLSQEFIATKENYERLIHIWDFSQGERYILELSHDEEPLPRKLKGGAVQKRDCMKSLFTYFFAFPGKKLIFMSRDFGQLEDWDIFHELNWKATSEPDHAVLLAMIEQLNRHYQQIPALHKEDMTGFEWIDREDPEYGIIAFLRVYEEERILAVFNFSTRERVRAFPALKPEDECEMFFTSDAASFGGSDRVTSQFIGPRSEITIPPMSGTLYRLYRGGRNRRSTKHTCKGG